MSIKLILRIILITLLLGATCSQALMIRESKKAILLEQEVSRYRHYLEILFGRWPDAVRHPDKAELLEEFDHGKFVDICIQDLLGPNRDGAIARFDKGLFMNATWAAKFGSTQAKQGEDVWKLSREAQHRGFAANDALRLYGLISNPEQLHAEIVCIEIDIVLHDKIETLKVATIP